MDTGVYPTGVKQVKSKKSWVQGKADGWGWMCECSASMRDLKTKQLALDTAFEHSTRVHHTPVLPRQFATEDDARASLIQEKHT